MAMWAKASSVTKLEDIHKIPKQHLSEQNQAKAESQQVFVRVQRNGAFAHGWWAMGIVSTPEKFARVFKN